MMNKTPQSEHFRRFLTEGLPDPLTPASSHLQLFDNYAAGTRLRLRSIRDPYSKAWTRLLQQRFSVDEAGTTVWKIVEMHLNDAEYMVLERLEGREIRKNRYFHEVDRVNVSFDIYLGPLWGLNIARVDFESLTEMTEYIVPPFAVIEITKDAFFFGENLVEKAFADIREHLDAGIQLSEFAD